MSNLKGIHDYTIAEHPIRIEFLEDGRNDTRLLPSFAPFEIEGRHEEETLFFQLTVDDTMRPEPKERRERIRKFDTGNGETVVDLVDDGGYQYIIKDINGAECCLLRSDKEFRRCRCALNGNYNMRSFGLNNALMLIFAFAGSRHDTLLIHASLVRQNQPLAAPLAWLRLDERRQSHCPYHRWRGVYLWRSLERKDSLLS